MFPRNCLKIKETSLPPHFWKDLLPFVFLVVTFNLSIPPFIRNDCLEEQLLGKVRFSRGAIILGEQTIICSVTQPSAFWIWFDNSILSFDSKIWFVNLIYGFDSMILGEHLPWHAILNFVDLINNQQLNQVLSNGTIFHRILRYSDKQMWHLNTFWRAGWDTAVSRFLSRDQQLCRFNRITGRPQSKECIYFDMPGYEAQISHMSTVGKVKGGPSLQKVWHPLIYDCIVAIQRHRHSGNLLKSVEAERYGAKDLPMYIVPLCKSTPASLTVCTLGLGLIRLFADQ